MSRNRFEIMFLFVFASIVLFMEYGRLRMLFEHRSITFYNNICQLESISNMWKISELVYEFSHIHNYVEGERIDPY
jgi:hypothetical protein